MVAKKKPATKSTKAKPTHKRKSTSVRKKLFMDEPPMKSFKLSRELLPFMTFRITRQTVYWSVLLIIVMILELWVLKLQLDVIHITDSILNQ